MPPRRPNLAAAPEIRPTLLSEGAAEGATARSLTPSRISIPRLELIVESLAGAPATDRRVVESDVVRIGSHASNDLVVADPFVSRFHCRLERRASGWAIRDEGSSNGTRLDGVLVRDADLSLRSSSLSIGNSRVRVTALVPETELSVAQAPGFGRIVGRSLSMRRMFERIRKIAASPLDVLVEGESGTGKELVAWELVQNSQRARRPLVVLDCGAISPNLFESELFGHTKGAFSGAVRDRQGAFEVADGGTIFLDEIGELPLALQAKLLRALAEREVRRVGETLARKVDVRVIAATNRPLEREVNQGRFREDLFHRLAVARVTVPPLRERIDDLPFLVEVFVAELEAQDKLHLFTAQMDHLMSLDWSGNVRELKNYVARMVIFNGDDLGDPPSPPASEPPPAAALPPNLDEDFGAAKQHAIDAFERHYLTALIRATRGNVSEASRRARVDRMHLHRLLQRHGLRELPSERPARDPRTGPRRDDPPGDT